MQEWELIEREPTVEEYQRLRDSAGWEPIALEAIESGLQNGLFAVCAVVENQAVGCGRLTGDGGLCFYVQDIIVLPEYQGRGIGRAIMESLMDYLESHAQQHAFIGLFANTGVSGLYEKFGFGIRSQERPGMAIKWKKST